jgi:hypothetical protein
VIVLTFIFFIFLKLMMYHMVIGGCKRGVIKMNLIVGALKKKNHTKFLR